MKKFSAIMCMLAVLTALVSCGETPENSTSVNTEVSTETETSEADTVDTEKESETTTQEESTEPVTEDTTFSEIETEPPTETESVTDALQDRPETIETTSETISEAEITTEQPSEEPVSDEKVITAMDIMQYFIDNNAPSIGEYVERTENDDKFLGRPELYVSKVAFKVTSVEFDEDDPYDVSIEVYNNADDALKRYSEMSSLMEQYPMFQEYLCLNDKVLMRIKFDVVPSEEKVYEQLLDDYINN